MNIRLQHAEKDASMLTIDPGRFIFACGAFGMLYQGTDTVQELTIACYDSISERSKDQGDCMSVMLHRCGLSEFASRRSRIDRK